MNDQQFAELSERIKAAVADKHAYNIHGGKSKQFYTGRSLASDDFSTVDYNGIVSYEPSELVITTRAGTNLRAVESMLASKGQQFAFEPPAFSADATMGGMIASGFSGPRRPFGGAVRDSVLGIKLLNGRGEVLNFGGQVIKNVAGYDVSRLVTGAFGTLGLILETSVKVVPKPLHEKSFVIQSYSLPLLSELSRIRKLLSNLTGLASYDGDIVLRLAGSDAAIQQSLERLGSTDTATAKEGFWRSLKDQTHAFFAEDSSLWRVSVPPAAGEMMIEGEVFYDWCGALRWLKTNAEAEQVHSAAAALGGNAVLFRAPGNCAVSVHNLPRPLQALHRRIKQSFDPHDVFNPGFFTPESE